MESIIPENEYTEVEGRVYSNPQIGIEETSDFIEKLRATQGQQNQEIAQQTQRLGTDVPTNLGGLTGADSYFTSRYQTPQTISNIANLRATAQAAALNEVLANEQAIWKKRYQDAYRNYQKRNYDRSKSYYSGGGGGTGGGGGDTTGGVEYEDTTGTSKTVGSVEPSYSPAGSGDFEYQSGELGSGTGSLGGNTPLSPTNTLTPSGNVNIQRDKFGNITSLTYDGRTFTGDAARQRYQWLQSTGTIGGRK